MEQAFGPGHRGGLFVEHEPMHKRDRIVVAASAVAALALLVILVWGGA